MSKKRKDKVAADARAHEWSRAKIFWSDQWPNLNSVAISIDPDVSHYLPADVLGVLYKMVWHIAGQSVYSAYSNPDHDPRIDLSEGRCVRILGISERDFQLLAPKLEPHFQVSEGIWRLRAKDWIRFVPEVRRPALSQSVRASILERDGPTCRYCAATEGPFDIDHIIPVVQGGSDDPSNLCVACVPCNRSKGGRTLEQWGGPQ